MLVKERCGLHIFVGVIMLNCTEIKLIKHNSLKVWDSELSLECWESHEHVTAVSYLILSSFNSRREWIGVKGVGKCVRLQGSSTSN